MKKFWLALFMYLFLAAPVFAVKVLSIYEAEVPVITQADELKEQAINDGFLQVLVKISGDPDIAKNPVIKASLKKASYYVQEYSYSSPTTASSEYILKIRYEPNDIIRLLKKSGTVYWRENRPLILIWLAVTNQQNETEIIGSDTPGKIFEAVKQQGKKYGLPVIFPLLDVTDMDQVTTTDVADMSIPTLKEAAKRYAPDAMLIGKIEEGNGETQSQWQLMMDDNVWNFSIADKNPENVIAVVMDHVRRALEKPVANAAPVSNKWLTMQVTNVAERDDLKTLIQYLEKLSSVQQVKLLQVSGSNVELSINVRGTRDTFQQNALQSSRLVFNLQNTTENKMVYEWVHQNT